MEFLPKPIKLMNYTI